MMDFRELNAVSAPLAKLLALLHHDGSRTEQRPSDRRFADAGSSPLSVVMTDHLRPKPALPIGPNARLDWTAIGSLHPDAWNLDPHLPKGPHQRPRVMAAPVAR